MRLAIVLLPVALAACQQRPAADAPVTTTSPAGQSTAPAAAEADQRNNALVRVVQAIPAEATLDIYADTNRIFNALAFRTVSPYQEVAGNSYTFTLRPAGLSQAEPLASNQESVEGGEHYTLFVLPGEGAAASLHVVADEHVAPSSQQAQVRIVQGSGDAGAIDVYAAGRNTPIFTDVEFQEVTGYQAVEPFTGSLELRPTGEPQAMLTVPDVSFQPGRSYTVVLVGRVRVDPPLETFIFEDRVAAARP